ncbi:MAG: hypothetical protein ACRDMJ_05590, partial [Solirubrobacteraceae bacterium]
RKRARSRGHTGDRARRALVSLTVAVCGGSLAGCAGIPNPYQARTRTTASTTPTAGSSTPATPSDAGDPSPERSGTVPPRSARTLGALAAGAARPTAHAALWRYAILYVNWRAATVAAGQRRLAAISLGQARAQALQAAASLGHDRQLTASSVIDTGTVVAIAAGQGPAAGHWVIVTRERTTGRGDYAGLPPTLHVIYAQLTHSQNGWIVTGWQPQD